MTAHAEYLDPLTPGNAAVPFIDRQMTLMLGAGELQSASMNKGRDAAMARLPQLMARLGAYTPAPPIISENSNHTGG